MMPLCGHDAGYIDSKLNTLDKLETLTENSAVYRLVHKLSLGSDFDNNK